MLLEPISPKILAVRTIAHAHKSVIEQYGGDTNKHHSLGLITCDQDDATYVALDEATKHANVDIIFAKSFYAGASHSSGELSGEILGVLAGKDPDVVEEGLRHTIRCLEHDACFYSANDAGTIAIFPHVITSLGYYLSEQSGLPPGSAMAYLVAPPIEATIAFDIALKSAHVKTAKMFSPPTETNFAALWLGGELAECEAAAAAFTQACVEVGRNPQKHYI